MVKSVGGDVLTWTDPGRPAAQTVTYTVRARDAAGNHPPDTTPRTRPRTGRGRPPGPHVPPA
ncbi:hypothetical protein, partial [Streptomyces albidoflavus]|uniref:hypothetical protein n=1 Tax=Streptomyces albidoflavus TaxID=1886 RepID=UPI001C53ADE1